jgi:hypothetical protein
MKVIVYIAILVALAVYVSSCVIMIPMAVYGIVKAANEHQECEKSPDRCQGKYDGDPRT